MVNKAEVLKKVCKLREMIGEIAVPVDIEAIAKKLNTKLFYKDMPDAKRFNGVVIATDKELSGYEYHILINSSTHPLRQRFTALHEIAHIFLEHRNKEMQVCTLTDRSAMEIRRQEREANIFASELLMPEDLIRKYYKEGMTLEDLVQIFGASLAAIHVRLEELGLVTDIDSSCYFSDPSSLITHTP